MLDFNQAAPQNEPRSRDWVDQDDLSAALADRAYEWVPRLFPKAKRDDEGHYRCANIRGDPPRKNGSCVIYSHGDHAGSWHDYDPIASPNGGGPLSTIKEITGRNGDDLFAFCRDLVGAVVAQPRRTRIARDDTAEIMLNLNSARQITPNDLGGQYFASRKIPMPFSRSMGFYDNCTDFRTRRGVPAIICRFTYPDGKLTDPDGRSDREAIHRIYLGHKEDGTLWHVGKRMLGSVDHGRIIILGSDDESHTVGIGEGVESTAAGMAICRVAWGWAAASAGGMSKLAEWLEAHLEWTREHVRRIVLFGDTGKAGTKGGNDIYDFAKRAGIAADWLYPIGNDDLADDLFYERVGHRLPFQLTGTSQLSYPSKERVLAELAAMPHGRVESLKPLLLSLAHYTLGEELGGNFTVKVEQDAVFNGLKAKGFGNIDMLRQMFREAYQFARRSNQQELQQLADEDKLEDWRALATRNLDGSYRANLHNVVLAIKHDPLWRDSSGKMIIAHNDFRGFPVVRGVLPWERARITELGKDVEPYRDWSDADDLAATFWVQQAGRDISATTNVVQGAIEHIAAENKFHPLRDMFKALDKWDGKERLSQLLPMYAGCEDTRLNRLFGRKWCIGAVARVMKPGIKMDTALILEGLQGLGKSTFFKILAGEDFFTDQISEFGSKDSALEMQGVWIIELAELDAMGKAETTRIKRFLTQTDDRFRPPYGKRLVRRSRQMVFCGTTNEHEYLRDPTGGRRFWPAKAGRLALDMLAEHRDQIWAEALVAFQSGEHWWLDDDNDTKAATEQQSMRYQSDVLESDIANWARGTLTRHEVRISEVLFHALNITDRTKWDKPLQMRVSSALRRLHYYPAFRRGNESVYVLKDEEEINADHRSASITAPETLPPPPPQQVELWQPSSDVDNDGNVIENGYDPASWEPEE